MSAHHEKEDRNRGYNKLTGVAWSILVMGLSLAAVIILWVWFGYIGPTFSEDIMAHQQRMLREEFGLPVEEASQDPEVLQTPPSLRNIEQVGADDLAPNTTTATAAAGGGGQEGEGTGVTATGNVTSITILAGSSVQGSPDYEPEDDKVPLNDNIVWVNKDTVPHTATSGTGAEDPNSAKVFDTSIINGGEESAPQQLKGVKEGDEVPYYCQVHPYMTSKLIVTAASAAGGASGTAGSAGAGGANVSITNTTTRSNATLTNSGGGSGNSSAP
jgi:plastocyanin